MSPPAARPTWPCSRACRAAGWSCTATTSPTRSCGQALSAGVGRIVVDSFDEIDRLERLVPGVDPGRAGPCRPAPGDPGHRGPHPRVRPDRPGRLEVRLRPELGCGRRGRRPPAAVPDPRSSWSACTAHIGSQIFALSSFERTPRGAGRRSSCPSASPSWSSAAASAWPTSTARRRRRSPSGRRRCAEQPSGSGYRRRCGSPPSRGGLDRGGGRRSPVTPSARSSPFPASAPT